MTRNGRLVIELESDRAILQWVWAVGGRAGSGVVEQVTVHDASLACRDAVKAFPPTL